jgi:hypothetical protein
MVAVVHGGSQVFKAMVSGERHPNTVQYLRNQMAQMQAYIGNAATDWSQRVVQSYETFSSDNAMRIAQAAIRKVTTHFQEDRIVQLDTLAQLQQAQSRMQRFIMACPAVRAPYHEQMCDGYSGSYVDMWPQDMGRGHYDYDRVMDGLIVEVPASKEDPEASWMCYAQLDEDVLEGDRRLTMVEKDQILTTWDKIGELMGNGLEDPTSATGGML